MGHTLQVYMCAHGDSPVKFYLLSLSLLSLWMFVSRVSLCVVSYGHKGVLTVLVSQLTLYMWRIYIVRFIRWSHRLGEFMIIDSPQT